jgi:arabinosyltransferase B
VLLLWWLIAPAFFDDGWTIARQSAFATTGTFSNYYESFGVGLPLGFWLEWLQQWVTQSSDALVLMRVPTLFCLAAIWIVCRWSFSQIHGPFRRWAAPAPWALAAAFAAVAMAWGMSLRQEPAVALLATGVVACAIRFVQTRSTAAIALAAVLVPLALTAHPAGIVALAPLIAIGFECARWARAHPATAVTILTASGAITLALAFVGSDVNQRALDAQTLSQFSTTVADWREELSRYAVMTVGAPDHVGYSAPLRRGAVALMVLAALAYVFRRNREARPLLDLPARALIVSLLLFVATPSKWPWHFGALLGFVVLAVAAETCRWREMRQLKSVLVRSGAALFTLILAISWSWSPRGSWNAVDLRTLNWSPHFERLIPLGTVAAALPVVLVALGLIGKRLRRASGRDVLTSVVSWAAPVLVVPLAVFTVSLLVLDAGRTSDWTAARENVSALDGTDGCGLADDLQVPALDSIRPLPSTHTRTQRPTSGWIPDAPSPSLMRFGLGPSLASASATPWFSLVPGGDVGWFVSGHQGLEDRLEVQWATRRARVVEILRSDDFTIRPTVPEEGSLTWRFMTQAEFRPAPRRATIVRIALENRGPPAGALAVTGPFSYTRQPLARQLASSTSTLVLPHALTFFPCAELPRLQFGLVEPPSLIVSTRKANPLLLDPGTSPFNGVLDLYRIERLPVTDSSDQLTEIAAYRVDAHTPNWTQVKADRE